MSNSVETFDNLVTHLNYRWKLHKDLFQGSDQYALFNESGGRVWLAVRDSVIDSVFMDIARLLDPPKSCGKDNLSMDRMIQLAKPNSYGDILGTNHENARKLYDELIKPWRNRRLSHNDLETLVGDSELPEVPFAQIDKLIDMINEVGRYISLADKNVDRTFPPMVTSSAWIPRLFRVLRLGVAALPEEIKKEIN